MTHDEQASLKFVRVESKDDEASNPEEFNKTTSSFVGVSPLPCLPDDQQLFDTNTDEANREEIKTAGFKGEPTRRETGDVIHELDEENNPEDEQLRQKRSANLRPEQRQSQLSRHSEEKVSNNSETAGGVQPGFNGSE